MTHLRLSRTYIKAFNLILFLCSTVNIKNKHFCIMFFRFKTSFFVQMKPNRSWIFWIILFAVYIHNVIQEQVEEKKLIKCVSGFLFVSAELFKSVTIVFKLLLSSSLQSHFSPGDRGLLKASPNHLM